MSSATENAKAVSPPLQGSIYLDLATADWQPDGDKFWIKPIYENPARGERTLLMKIGAGARYPLHAHDETEQIYVLSGSFSDQDRTLKAGDYCCRAPGAIHSTDSDEGAVVLLVYSRA